MNLFLILAKFYLQLKLNTYFDMQLKEKSVFKIYKHISIGPFKQQTCTR